MKRALAGTALAGAAAIGMPAVAAGEVVNFAPHERAVTTADGWDVSLRLEEESWNRVPTTNMTGTSREGYGSLRAVVKIDGRGAPLNGAQLSVGYLIGCFADLNYVSPSFRAEVGPSIGLQPGIPIPGANLGANVGPSLSASISPGQIKAYPIAQKNIEAAGTVLQIRDVHMNIDGCLGPAQVRAYATIGVDTTVVKDTASVYGDTFPI